MGESRHLDERDRRWQLLNAAMERDDLDALLFAANDYRGHKGSLRYVADYNLAHRSGYAVMLRNREPILVLSGSLISQRRPASAWVTDYRFPGTVGEGLVDALRDTRVRRVGIVGLGQVMKVDEYLALTAAYPSVTFIDYSSAFETLRSVKSELEIQGAEESAYILDQCFARLLEIARPGMTEREIASEMHRVGHLLGGEDPLFLTMHTDYRDDQAFSTFGVPRDRVLRPHDILTFSYEIVGPLGYWTELSRMVTFASPSADYARMGRAVRKGITAGANSMKVGALPSVVQREVLRAIGEEGASSSYWSGHSLGLDVLESPWIGLDVVEDAQQNTELPIESGYVLTLHPMVVDASADVSGYMADTFVIDESGPRKLSEHPTGLYTISKGNVNVDES
ncbi:M24 family metallopeptidase [Diaminobutyricimonas sp. TR449]|uniref:M24 family metallopeptidase n=1 Tax=Diaminobutyricimonas sp. TR449 TaxID=2708076 RepID=UPI00142251B4|nr:M24 family metallopeptidase [Diaminobutyricimonas sp. TR449]